MSGARPNPLRAVAKFPHLTRLLFWCAITITYFFIIKDRAPILRSNNALHAILINGWQARPMPNQQHGNQAWPQSRRHGADRCRFDKESGSMWSCSMFAWASTGGVVPGAVPRTGSERMLDAPVHAFVLTGAGTGRRSM